MKISLFTTLLLAAASVIQGSSEACNELSTKCQAEYEKCLNGPKSRTSNGVCCLKDFQQETYRTSDNKAQKTYCICQIHETKDYSLVPERVNNIFVEAKEEGRLPWFSSTTASQAGSSTQVSCKKPENIPEGCDDLAFCGYI